MGSRSKEPSTAPRPEEWYPIVLGSSLKEQPSKRYYSLRYEFKPASIDTSRPGSLHKSADNKVTVEFCNNQPGKPNVAFQGINEDCKDLDAVLFFDGKSFRLERLHRAVKTLRHLRLPGESASASNIVANADTRASPLHPNGHGGDEHNAYKPPRAAQEHVEEIVLGSQHESAASGGTTVSAKKTSKASKSSRSKPSPILSPPRKRTSPSLLDIVDDDVPVEAAGKKAKLDSNDVENIDINIDDDEGGEEHDSEYEVEDVDVSDDEEEHQNSIPAAATTSGLDPPPQPPGADKQQQQSSSSSGSSSSGSGSESGSESSDDESASLGDI